MSEKYFQRCLLILFFGVQMTALPLFAQTSAPDPKLTLLLGRWEVVNYSEQGVQVDKKQAALPQAIAVYRHNRAERARQFYGYSEYEDYSRHESRNYNEWAVRDSAVEVARVAQAIALPYFAVFFADSTLSIYNKELAGNQTSFPEAKHFSFVPATMSIDMMPTTNAYDRWQGQILLLTATRMTLFLPETAEVVELVKTPFTLP